MENELVGFACDLLDAPGHGGRHGHLRRHRVVPARRAGRPRRRPDVDATPRWCCPTTAHAAFHKAAHYFGVELSLVPVGPDFRADAGRDGRGDRRRHRAGGGLARRRTPTAWSTRSPRSPPPPPRAGVRCHVDACIGGWVLPYAARLGRDGAAVDLRGRRRHLDLRRHPQVRLRPQGHLAAAAPHAELRRPQFFASADWPGYTMLNSTMQSTKSGGPLAGAWAVVQSLGDDGYLDLAGRRSRRSTRSSPASAATAALRLLVAPDSTLVTAGDRRHLRPVHDVRRDGDARVVRPAAAVVRRPPANHPPLGAAPPPWRTSRSSLAALARGRRGGASPPARWPSTPGVVAFIEALDPATLTDDGLRRAARGLRAGRRDGDGRPGAAGADGRGQRHARRRPRPRCARRCSWPSWTGCRARCATDVSALAGLVEKGLVAPDWAEALAPVDDRIAAMGRFLREELAAGRRLPAGRRPHPAGVPAPAGRRPRAGRRPGPLPDARPPDRAELRRRRATSGRCRRALRNIYAELRDDLGVAAAAARRPDRVGRPGRDAAQPGAHRAARRAPRRTAAGAGRRSPSARSPRWPAAAARCAAILWGRDAQSLKPMLGAGPVGRVGAPVAAVGLARLLRLAALRRVNALLGDQGGARRGLVAAGCDAKYSRVGIDVNYRGVQ